MCQNRATFFARESALVESFYLFLDTDRLLRGPARIVRSFSILKGPSVKSFDDLSLDRLIFLVGEGAATQGVLSKIV